MSRCVECGYPKERHGKDLLCPVISSRKHFSTMDLPPGKTCHNCHFVKKCCAMFGKTPTDTTCDFFPVRFMERPL